MRRFNVTGLCVPSEDYMVDISSKLVQIKKLVDERRYFTINRARQYGKTTTLSMLQKKLEGEYICVRLSFEGIGDEGFESPEVFCQTFMEMIMEALEFANVTTEYQQSWVNKSVVNFKGLSRHISKMCKDKKVVLMIDEVDKTSNNRVFLHFLGTLRDKFMARKDGMDHTFHSVILAGVYDIKNIKLKMMHEGRYTPEIDESKLYNSPWNIAVNFKVDMSFGADEIATMLEEYEADHSTGMDINGISWEIYSNTSGYPFLVSRICQCIDEELNKNWTSKGVQNAIKIILYEKNMLFDDMFKNLENYKELYDFFYDLLFVGTEKTFNIDNPIINLGYIFGFLINENGKARVANRIFEIRMYNYFISKESDLGRNITGVLQYDVVKDGRFDMELCLCKFAEHYAELFNEHDITFLEKHGRLLFLTYLKPLINGQGFYHIESQFTDLRRMDIVVDYGHDQFIIELKVWHGTKYKEGAYKQLLSYMDSKNADSGYLLTFDFRKGSGRQPCAQWVDFGAGCIFDVVV